MLRLPFVAAVRRSCARSFASEPFPESPDRLAHLLGEESTTTPSLWGNAAEDEQFLSPPQAPPGSLPPGSAPAPRLKSQHGLPDERLYHLHVFSSRNNTILTFTDAIGNPRGWVSAGQCGFKHVQRSGYEAGYQCAVKMFEKIVVEKKKTPAPMKLVVSFKGFGFGREALYRALMATEGEKIRDTVIRLKDTTPIKIGGTKAKKARRL